MITSFSASWLQMEPLMQGLKRGGLINQCLEEDDTYRQGRHHVMAAVNQILEWSIALEQVAACFETVHLSYPITPLHVAKYIVPVSVAYLASSQIETLHINEMANTVQEHLGKTSLLVTAIATAALFLLSQQMLAVVTMAYLATGLLDRWNILSETTQHRLRQANFIIANLAGLYFGGNFIRAMCVINMVVAAVQKYFQYLRQVQQDHADKLKVKQAAVWNDPILSDEASKGSAEHSARQMTMEELQKLRNETSCPVNKSHVHTKALPAVKDDVQIDEILVLAEQIDWKKHEHVIKGHLAKDNRWLELGQYTSEPIDYFRRNLESMIESIRDRKILQGKPQNYDMLQYYCRYIAQALKEQDEMSQADYLILLGIDGGEYCGTGKFGIVEEVFESLLALASGLPLDMRIFACEQQERVRVWQNIYQMTWLINPFWQMQGYFTEINAVHNANLFINLVQAGEKFGIPHQAALNDQTAVFNPATHYLAFSLVQWIEDSFWSGKPIPQCYFTFESPKGADRWKPWKWAKLKIDSVSPTSYNQQAMLSRLHQTIGTPQISKYDIYSWWNEWIERQTQLPEQKREELIDELTMNVSIDGEKLEIDGKIQDKFLLAMLIEMGALEKPAEWLPD